MTKPNAPDMDRFVDGVRWQKNDAQPTPSVKTPLEGICTQLRATGDGFLDGVADVLEYKERALAAANAELRAANELSLEWQNAASANLSEYAVTKELLAIERAAREQAAESFRQQHSVAVEFLTRAETAEQRLAAVEAQLAGVVELLREWLNTEMDPMDDEYAPWMESFTSRVNAAIAAAPTQAPDEKDAERYRWLKTIALPRYIQRIISGDSPSTYREDDYQIWAASWDELDAAIDAAMQKECG